MPVLGICNGFQILQEAGLLPGAALIGGLQKGIEVMNPGNTLAAQTFMILFIIVFIQFRPRGIMPQRGRAAAA